MPPFVPVHPPRNPGECDKWLYEAITALNRHASQSTQSFGAIIRGESPDGSGATLVDTGKFFYKPGIAGGQIAFGGTNAGDPLTLSSTAAGTKGKIYLGSASSSAFDEANNFLGVGTGSPAAPIHANTGASGVVNEGDIGNVMARFTAAT
jgi:hypothetical protein